MDNTDGTELCTQAETLAQRAEGLPSIGGFNLLAIKRTVSHLLGAIGGACIFDEYTKHDISHINEMLRLLDWIVPERTKSAMSSTDWLHVVLGVYFHDLGMLVTEREYELRGNSGFIAFKDKILLAGPNSGDYKAKISLLGPDRAERFFYQEFVRDAHARRIRAWLNGTASDQWGVTNVPAEIQALLQPFGEQFRDDLGVICESHHLDDLDNLKKYSISRAYGRSAAEVANIQYSAILLRTADILHMTKDRTPSVMYRVTNPTDPISQREWRKQMGVNRLCAQLGKDADGVVSDSAPRDTIEVHAFFTEAEPFFALSTFLNYVESQLQQCHQWCEKAVGAGAKVSFPWRRIDREHIDAKGFLSKVFAFELDQPKILNLLTGHTLYNDSGVVLRELVQNSIDAIRLQRHNDKLEEVVDSTGAGVLVRWLESDRRISVEDVGTGMTQEIVEQHLLRVGSSRYSTDKFKKTHPNFFPISRFGIGILTAFMIADEVDIYTCHPDEAEARHILLRNLHGKYLVKLLPKNDKKILPISPHGTRIELKLRPSAKLANVESILRTWVVVPNCNVRLRIDDSTAMTIGHASAREALAAALARAEVTVSNDDPPRQGDVRVLSVQSGFADVAFAVRWSETFKEWDFLRNQSRDPRSHRRSNRYLGTCIEGIRVEFGSAGYQHNSLYVLVNASGAGSPKTNVARSGLEHTTESKELNRLIYEALFSHVKDEIDGVRRRRNLSRTGAASEGKYLMAPLLETPADSDVFSDCVKGVPLLLVEHEGVRKSVSPRELEREPLIWTIECPLFRSAEHLLREAESDASLSTVVGILAKSRLPSEPILCRGGLDDEWALGERGVVEIILEALAKRVDFGWQLGSRDLFWKGISGEAIERVLELPELRLFEGSQEFMRDGFLNQVFIPVGRKTATGATFEICVCSLQGYFFLPHAKVGKIVEEAVSAIESAQNPKSVAAAVATMMLIRTCLVRRYLKYDEASVSRFVERSSLELSSAIDVRALTDALNELSLPGRVFDPAAWERASKPAGLDFGYEL